MKAITIWQPWASLIAQGAKRFETRSWAPAHRGPIAIHAGTHWTRDIRFLCLTEPYQSCLFSAGIESLDQIPRGAVIATAELVECHRVESIRSRLSEQERTFGDYTNGRFAWELANVAVLDEPVRTSGAQQLWNWTREGA